ELREGNFVGGAKVLRSLGKALIVYVQYDAMADALEPQHGTGEQIAADAADDVLRPQTAVGAVATAAVTPLPGGRVLEHDHLVFEIFDFDARIWIGELAAARQFDEQVGAGTLEQKSAAANYLLTVAYCFPGFHDRSHTRTSEYWYARRAIPA